LKQVEDVIFQSVSTDFRYEPRNSFRGGLATKLGRFIVGNHLTGRRKK
jgi:hypothetical protein